MCSGCGRPPNTTYTHGPTVNYVKPQPGPVPLKPHIQTLELAAEKVGEVGAFTRYLLPNEYDYDRVQEALRALAQRLNDALP